MGSIDPVYIGIDGGNSKTAIAVADISGNVLGAFQGSGSSPDKLGLEGAISVLVEQIDHAMESLALSMSQVGSIYAALAGLDLDRETQIFRGQFVRRFEGIEVRVENDVVAALLAGTRGGRGIAVICGAGFNAAARDSQGKLHSFLSLGPVSGDWGGGISLGRDVLWHAARSEDGRGSLTELRDIVLKHFDADSVSAISQAVHRGELRETDLADLSPGLFDAAEAGDLVAKGIVSRLSAEVGVSVRALMNRAELSGSDVPVVLSGSILVGGNESFRERVHKDIVSAVGEVDIRILDVKPVAGALIGAARCEGDSEGNGFVQAILSHPDMGLGVNA